MNNAIASSSGTLSTFEFQGVLTNIPERLTEITDRSRVQDAKLMQLMPMVLENKTSIQHQLHKNEEVHDMLSEHSRQLHNMNKTLTSMQAAQSSPPPPPSPPPHSLPTSPRIYERTNRSIVHTKKTQFSYKKIRDDARSLKLSPALPSQQSAPFNFRKFGSALHGSLKVMFPQFPLESIETIRRDFKGNVYSQFHSSHWTEVQELLGYSSSSFTELPIMTEGW